MIIDFVPRQAPTRLNWRDALWVPAAAQLGYGASRLLLCPFTTRSSACKIRVYYAFYWKYI